MRTKASTAALALGAVVCSRHRSSPFLLECGGLSQFRVVDDGVGGVGRLWVRLLSSYVLFTARTSLKVASRLANEEGVEIR